MALKKNKSALKRERQNENRRASNKSALTAIKTQIKKVVQASEGEDKEKAGDEYVKMASMVCKAAGKGLIHKNKAARHMSRLAKRTATASAKK